MKHFCSLSEAIREGSKLRPQSFEKLTHDSGTCAIGAGVEAMGYGFLSQTHVAVELLLNHFPYIGNSTDCPVAGCEYNDRDIARIIVHLNDGHHWSREQIADWLYAYEESIGFVTLAESESSRSQTAVSEMVMV